MALAACGVLASGLVALAGPARAADESPWGDDIRSSVRLIAGASKAGEPSLHAGIEIKMQPGWHTYWRYPGDAGVPPRFDFEGSENLKSVKVLYPAPYVHTDGGGQSLGYEKTVIFPVQVTPMQSGQPVTLRLKLDYAVCEKLCVPAEGRAELSLTGGDSAHAAAVATAEAKVPQPATASDLGLTVRRANEGAKPLVTVDVAAASGKPLAVFVEGPTPEWALPIPKPAQGAPQGRQHFSFVLDGLPSGVDPKGVFDLTFTVVDGERAFEVTTRLD